MSPDPAVASYGSCVAATIARTVPPGSTIGIVTPGSPPEGRAEVGRGIAWWRSHGYQVKLAPGALERDDWHAGSPQVRARDLQLATLPLGVDATVDANALTLTIDKPALRTS